MIKYIRNNHKKEKHENEQYQKRKTDPLEYENISYSENKKCFSKRYCRILILIEYNDNTTCIELKFTQIIKQ